jgi:hypothetical protein
MSLSKPSGDGTEILSVADTPATLQGCSVIATVAEAPELVKNISLAIGGSAACGQPGGSEPISVYNWTSPSAVPEPQPYECPAAALPPPASVLGAGDVAALMGHVGLGPNNLTVSQLGWMQMTSCIKVSPPQRQAERGTLVSASQASLAVKAAACGRWSNSRFPSLSPLNP